MAKPIGQIGLNTAVLKELRALGFIAVPESNETYDNGVDTHFEREFTMVKDGKTLTAYVATHAKSGKTTLSLESQDAPDDDFAESLLYVNGTTDKQVGAMLARFRKLVA